jgi:hypothetical protein
VNSGPQSFGRYAFPPNVLGYCGPADTGLTEGLMSAEASAELSRVIRQFEGAWPYLELIGGCTGRDPLDADVVEAYWIGNELLDGIDMLTWGNSVDVRFRQRAGGSWSALSSGIVEGRPNHAFHVFCVYPWVGLLRSGYADHALEVVDRCRIRWGQVTAMAGSDVIVESRPLSWDGETLALGGLQSEVVRGPMLKSRCRVGDTVSLHWDYVCETLEPDQLRHLKQQTRLHLDLANGPKEHLVSAIER